MCLRRGWGLVLPGGNLEVRRVAAYLAWMGVLRGFLPPYELDRTMFMHDRDRCCCWGEVCLPEPGFRIGHAHELQLRHSYARRRGDKWAPTQPCDPPHITQHMLSCGVACGDGDRDLPPGKGLGGLGGGGHLRSPGCHLILKPSSQIRSTAQPNACMFWGSTTDEPQNVGKSIPHKVSWMRSDAARCGRDPGRALLARCAT